MAFFLGRRATCRTCGVKFQVSQWSLTQTYTDYNCEGCAAKLRQKRAQRRAMEEERARSEEQRKTSILKHKLSLEKDFVTLKISKADECVHYYEGDGNKMLNSTGSLSNLLGMDQNEFNWNAAYGDYKTPIIVDNGGCEMAAGFAGAKYPTSVFPTVVAKQHSYWSTYGKNTYVGDEVESHYDFLHLNYPIQRGVIRDWDVMEQIWNYTFNKMLEINPVDHPILLTETPYNPRKNQDRMVETMFETFQFPAVYVDVPAVLSMYACGKKNGVIFDSGDGVSYAVPFIDGYALPYAICYEDLAGADVTAKLMNTLSTKGHKVNNEIARDIKETYCYVTCNCKQEMKKIQSHRYWLPGEEKMSIKVGKEQFQCAEVLFGEKGIHNACYRSILKCDTSVQKILFQNIVLCGGNALLPGFQDRICQEIDSLPHSSYVKTTLSMPVQQRQCLPWIGGSILASMSTFAPMCISRQEYMDSGPRIIRCKCFNNNN